MPPRVRLRQPNLHVSDPRRCFSCSPIHCKKTSTEPPVPPPSSRWLSDLQVRIGKCISFGCTPAQVSQAGVVLRALATEWRTLTAGSEGFLTGGRRGLEDHKVVWGVMDSFQHVNNVTYIRYAESSRVNWVTNFARVVDPSHSREWKELMTPNSTGLIMKAIRADFKLPMVYPDTISVYHKLHTAPPPRSEPAPSSFLLDCVVLSHRHRRPAAKLKEEITIYDYKAARKTGMPDYVRDVFEETCQLQEDETARARKRIRELEVLVTDLEWATWDRPDAVEDLGSATASGGGQRSD